MRCHKCFNLEKFCTCNQAQMLRHTTAPVPVMRTREINIDHLLGLANHTCTYCDRATEAALN